MIAEARQHEDVHGRVRVEPEDVLVEERVAAFAALKKTVPATRSRITISIAAAKNWVKISASQLAAKIAQTKIGRRPQVMPGARM